MASRPGTFGKFPGHRDKRKISGTIQGNPGRLTTMRFSNTLHRSAIRTTLQGVLRPLMGNIIYYNYYSVLFHGLLSLGKKYIVDVWEIQKHRLYDSGSGPGQQLHPQSSPGDLAVGLKGRGMVSSV